MNEKLNVPYHVGIILDGNGRWAKERGKPRTMGHDAGLKNLEKIMPHIIDRGVKVLSIFAFSTENFKRAKEEVDHLMTLFALAFKKHKDYFVNNDIKVVFSGDDENLPEGVVKMKHKLIEETKNNQKATLNICLNYGARREIVRACNKIIEDGIKNVEEKDFAKYLYNDLPDIDFIIRTSGEYRISNFMLWQLSYAELYFPKVYFPDFNEEEFDKAIIEYNKRNRRFGGV